MGEWGWVVLIETKANLAQFQMKLPAEAKLGKRQLFTMKILIFMKSSKVNDIFYTYSLLSVSSQFSTMLAFIVHGEIKNKEMASF